jgi:ABC-type arginine transport system permease subunit
MIGKIIGAFVGDRIARETKGMGGASGAALGVVAAAALRRMSLPAMLALTAGGLAAKLLSDRKARPKA